MRWIKHLTMAHADPAIEVLLERYGPEAYGVYWLILEHIASAMDKHGKMEPSATYSDIKWTSLCYLKRTQKFHNMMALFESTGLIQSENTATTVRSHGDNRVRTLRKLTVPNILKYKDEYSKKSGHTPEYRTEREQIQIQRENTTPTPPLAANAAVHVKKPEPKQPDPLETLIEQKATLIHERHPNDEGRRDIGPAGVRKHLRAIANLQPAADRLECIESLDRRHIAWCEHWRVHGYTKGLNNWLAPTVGRWASDPPLNGNGDGQMDLVPHNSNGTETYRERDRRLQREIMVKQITKGIEFYGKPKV